MIRDVAAENGSKVAELIAGSIVSRLFTVRNGGKRKSDSEAAREL